MTVKEFQVLKEKVDRLSADSARAEGELQGLMKRLKEEFGVSTVDAADEKLAAMKAKWAKLSEKCDKAEREFNTEFADAMSDAT